MKFLYFIIIFTAFLFVPQITLAALPEINPPSPGVPPNFAHEIYEGETFGPGTYIYDPDADLISWNLYTEQGNIVLDGYWYEVAPGEQYTWIGILTAYGDGASYDGYTIVAQDETGNENMQTYWINLYPIIDNFSVNEDYSYCDGQFYYIDFDSDAYDPEGGQLNFNNVFCGDCSQAETVDEGYGMCQGSACSCSYTIYGCCPTIADPTPSTFTLTVTDPWGLESTAQIENYDWYRALQPCEGGTESFTLTASKVGAGSGTVTSSPAGIDCGADCSENYTSETSVALTASAAGGSGFTGWSGGGCSGTGTCTVSMTQNRNVTATFIGTADGQPTATLDIQDAFGSPITSAIINQSVYLDVDGSSDPDGSISKVKFCSDDTAGNGSCDSTWTSEYTWTVSSGDWDAVQKKMTWYFATSGNKGVYAQVKDNNDAWSAIAEDTIIVTANQAPVAAIGCDPASCRQKVGKPLTFLNKSSDPDGDDDIIDSQWDVKQWDGKDWGSTPDLACTQPTALRDYTPTILTADNYTIELFVEDEEFQDTDTENFVIFAGSCGDGEIDPGEECDPPGSACLFGLCQSDCTCPLLIPKFWREILPKFD